MRRLLSALLILFFAVFFAAQQAHAINSRNEIERGNLDITLSPIFFEYTIKNQKQISDQFSVRNNSETPMELVIKDHKLGVNEQGNITIQNDNENDYKLVKIAKNRLTLASGETVKVSFEISIPKEAAYGNYRVISVSSNNEMQKSGNISLSGSANIPILIHIDKPGTISNAEIAEFRTENFINEYLPVDFSVKIKNTGNTHVRPRGNIFINDNRGKNIAILDINKDSGSILPKGIQNYLSGWSEGFFVKDSQNGNLKIQWDKPALFRFGKYTAHLFLVFDGGNKDIALESKLDFWVIPYTIIAVIFLILFIVILTIKFLLRIYIKSQVKKYSEKNN